MDMNLFPYLQGMKDIFPIFMESTKVKELTPYMFDDCCLTTISLHSPNDPFDRRQAITGDKKNGFILNL